MNNISGLSCCLGAIIVSVRDKDNVREQAQRENIFPFFGRKPSKGYDWFTPPSKSVVVGASNEKARNASIKT